MNKLLVTVGLLFAGNGLLLFLTPGRFASLRTMSRMPDQYNQAVTNLAARSTAARTTGAVAAATGLLLIALGLRQTKPAA